MAASDTATRKRPSSCNFPAVHRARSPRVRTLRRVTNSGHATKRGSIARKSFQFQMGFTATRARARANQAGGLIRAASTRYVSAHVDSQSADGFNFSPARFLSPARADPIFVPRGLIKNSTRSSYFMRNISSKGARKKRREEICTKRKHTDSAVSRELMRPFSVAVFPVAPPPPPPHRVASASGVSVRAASTYTRRLYDNGCASGSPCFRCDHRHPATHFSTLAL